MRETSDHAIVFGASLAGLLTARVLAEFYQQVTVVERDALPPAGQQRKGVPHGRHLHGLHPRGREILEELFPGFTAELPADRSCRLRGLRLGPAGRRHRCGGSRRRAAR